ncbi:MAG TPA: hypothetical protein VFE35_03050 [Candidatus Cybelea sp.]|jgi:hypothetical protein|nr:hypothetical protein [Candidatus Cybelea sp.]
MDASVIGTALISGTVSAGIVAGLISAAFKWATDRDLERVRATLKLDADTQLERLRSDLAAQRAASDALEQQLRDERQFRFIKLHERRLTAVEQVYDSMIGIRDALGGLIVVLRTRPDELEAALEASANAGDAFRAVYRRSRLLFPPDVAHNLEQFNVVSAALHNAALEEYSAGRGAESALVRMEALDSSQISRIADEMLRQFREYLGVN